MMELSHCTFDIIITRESGLPIKPSPVPVFHICSQWGLRPENVIVVGDHEDDVKCGLSAGAQAILFDPTSPQPWTSLPGLLFDEFRASFPTASSATGFSSPSLFTASSSPTSMCSMCSYGGCDPVSASPTSITVLDMHIAEYQEKNNATQSSTSETTGESSYNETQTQMQTQKQKQKQANETLNSNSTVLLEPTPVPHWATGVVAMLNGIGQVSTIVSACNSWSCDFHDIFVGFSEKNRWASSPLLTDNTSHNRNEEDDWDSVCIKRRW